MARLRVCCMADNPPASSEKVPPTIASGRTGSAFSMLRPKSTADTPKKVNAAGGTGAPSAPAASASIPVSAA